MSMKAVIAAVLLAVVLGGVLFLVNTGSKTPKGPPAPAMKFDPASVAALRLTPPGQAEQTATRAADGSWSTTLGALDWPLNPSGPQDVISRMAAMVPAPLGKDAKPPADPASPFTVVVAMRDGTSQTLRLGTDAVGGLVPAKVNEAPTMLVDAAILEAVRSPGIAGWRVMSALPGAGGDTARVTITAGETTLGFARENGQWALRRPVAARADQKAVGELVARLGRLGIERFIDNPSATDRSASGLDKPRMVIQTERDVRESGPTITMGVKGRELYVGRNAVSGTTTSAYAAPERSGNVLFMVPADALTSISTNARAYLASTASNVSPADVQIVSVRRGDSAEVGYRRQMGKWTRMDAGNASEVDAALVDNLLTFLTTQTGEPDIVLPGRPDGLRVLSRVTLVDLEGETRDVVSLGYNADGVLAARSGNLVVLYPGVAAPEILGIPAFADLPALPNENRRPSGGPVDSPK